MPPRRKKPRTEAMSTSATATPAAQPTATPIGAESPSGDRSHFSDRRFKDLPISIKLRQGIKHEFMTEVQAASIEPALSGEDLLVQAKTGTGKTIGFLLPAVEKLLKSPTRPPGASILVLSPTRELATQIAKEAKTLLPESELPIYTVTGGTSKSDLDKFIRARPHLVVATPGRLFDYLTGEKKDEVRAMFRGLQTLVLDEVDRLLDGGFARELNGITDHLPKSKRQNLFFSATISESVKQVAKKYNDGARYTFISTLKENEMNTHQHVRQSHIITPFDEHMSTLLALLHLDGLKHKLPIATTSTPSLSPQSQGTPTLSKVMVFFPTARHVSFATELLSHKPIADSLPPMFELHSRKSQPARNKATEAFRQSKSAILLSSDVAARGVDFPGVTLVIQVGLPASAEQYVHRLGRTARAGAEGQGIIILDPAEQSFLSSNDMRKTTTVTPYLSSPASHEAKDLATYKQTYATHIGTALNALGQSNTEVISQAYSAWLGYYKSSSKITKWTPERLVEEATNYARSALGWREELPPALETRTVGKMGLKGVRGLNVVKTQPREPRGQRQQQRQQGPV